MGISLYFSQRFSKISSTWTYTSRHKTHSKWSCCLLANCRLRCIPCFERSLSMTSIKNPTGLGGVGRCVRARSPAHILSTSYEIFSPDFPSKKRLQRILSSGQYFAVRNAFLADFSSRTGGSFLCIDLCGTR